MLLKILGYAGAGADAPTATYQHVPGHTLSADNGKPRTKSTNGVPASRTHGQPTMSTRGLDVPAARLALHWLLRHDGLLMKRAKI